MTAYLDFVSRKRRLWRGVPMQTARPLPDAMFSFQRFATEWAMRKGRAAMFADCGLGKTIMQLAWASQIDGPVLVLAPLAVAEQTQREGVRFGIASRIAHDSSDIQDGINICNYEKLHRLEGCEFAGLVLDESSILKAMDGKTSSTLIERFREVPYKLACSATPAPNDYMELGMHAEFLGVMSRAEMLAKFFVHDGAETQVWRLKGHARNEFWRWVCSWAIAFRRPSDLGFDDYGYILPPLQYEDVLVPSEFARDGELFATGTMSLTERRSARKASLDGRVQAAAEIANATSDQVLVWCDLNAESEALAATIRGAVEVRGSMPSEDKARAMLDFADGKIRVLVTKPSIAGHGMNWQTCSRMIFCGLSDSYEAMYQATRRCWRFGQRRPVQAWIVSSEAEGAVVDNVRRKEGDAIAMVDAMVSTMKEHGMDRETTNARAETYETDVQSGGEWTCHLGDCVEVLAQVPSDSIGFSVFSPPFASLYTYSESLRDMGNCDTGDEFAEHFKFLVRELGRVLMPGRSVSFHCMNLPTSKVRDGVIGLRDFRGELIRLFESEGFVYHSEVCIWKDPVTSMQRTKALGLLHKTIRSDSSMSRQGIPDYLVTMRKRGENPVPITHTRDEYPVSLWQQIASPIWMDINPSDTLQHRSAREDDDEKHICPLQLTVIRRALELWSAPGDLVLSPFAGIGSEGVVALELGRRFLGIELKRSYWEQACRNLANAEHEAKQPTLFDEKVTA